MPKRSTPSSTTPSVQLPSLRGIHDTLPEQLALAQYVEDVVAHRAVQAGFQRIHTPNLEVAALQRAALGPRASAAQLYTLTDPEGSELALRADGLAPLVRAYLQHDLGAQPQPTLLWFSEPVFRAEAPQKGRYREFRQYGFAALGEQDPALSAQIVSLAWQILTDLELTGTSSLHVNTLGTPEERRSYLADFTSFFEGKERALSAEDRAMLDANPLLLLRSTHEDTRILLDMAPKLREYLNAESRAQYEEFRTCLTSLGIPYTENPTITRTYDDASGIVFEVWEPVGDSATALGGGGALDGIGPLLGGPTVPGVGFAGGIERTVHALKAQGLRAPEPPAPIVFVAALGPEAKRAGVELLAALRRAGIASVGAVGGASMKAQLALAQHAGVAYTILLGAVETKEGKAMLRTMATAKQKTIKLSDAVRAVQQLLEGTTGA